MLDYITILGTGATLTRCPEKKIENGEYWGCNGTYKKVKIELDKLFIMKDLYLTQYNKEKTLIKDINEKDFPVYTLGKYPEIKNNIQYPVKEILKEFKIGYFLTNISYMLALAITKKPKCIGMFGVDMNFGTNIEYMRNEKSCIEFWLGVATGRGIEIHIPVQSTVMKRKGHGAFYGMKVKKEGNGLLLTPDYMWDREKCAAKYKIAKKSNMF